MKILRNSLRTVPIRRSTKVYERGHIGNGLDFLDPEHPEVRLPAVVVDQWAVVGAEVLGQLLTGDD